MQIHLEYKEKFNSKLGIELEYKETKTLGFRRYDPYQIVYWNYDFNNHSFFEKEERGQENSPLEIINIFEDHMINTYPDLVEKEVLFKEHTVSALVFLGQITTKEAMSNHEYDLRDSFFIERIKELKDFVDKFGEENITISIC